MSHLQNYFVPDVQIEPATDNPQNITFINFQNNEISLLPTNQVVQFISPPKFEDLSPKYKELIQKEKKVSKEMHPFLE